MWSHLHQYGFQIVLWSSKTSTQMKTRIILQKKFIGFFPNRRTIVFWEICEGFCYMWKPFDKLPIVVCYTQKWLNFFGHDCSLPTLYGFKFSRIGLNPFPTQYMPKKIQFFWGKFTICLVDFFIYFFNLLKTSKCVIFFFMVLEYTNMSSMYIMTNSSNFLMDFWSCLLGCEHSVNVQNFDEFGFPWTIYT